MPGPLAAKAGVIAVSVAVAAAIAVYESPELRRMADDLRRRIAIALHSLGDNIEPARDHQMRARDPMFNRPEDAEGFLQSRAEPGVDADDETRRRQREELVYWNSVHLKKKEQESQAGRAASSAVATDDSSSFQRNSMYASTFDDFLQPASSGERGSYVLNTGAELGRDDEGLVRRRGTHEGVRGLNASLYANPFADENRIDLDEQHPVMRASIISPGLDESMSDIYDATQPASPNMAQSAPQANSATVNPASADHNIASVLFDAANHLHRLEQQIVDAPSQRSQTLERELGPDEYMTAGQESHHEAYASIQAWAQNSSNTGFYSPLPVSPAAPLSEPEVISEGALTPTDSVSVIGSAEDVANDAVSAKSMQEGHRLYDVLSDDEDDGMATPVSWTEVGSVVSESDAGLVCA